MRSIRDLLEKWVDIPISNLLSVYYIPQEGDETKVHSSYEFPEGTFILRDYEKPHNFSWEFKPSMLKKLTEHYEWAQELDLEGHVVGYYNELNEKICDFYVFENGIFKLIKEKNNFYLWLFQR